MTDCVLLEAGDVARALRVSPASVRVYADKRLIRWIARTVRGNRLFRPEDVEAFAAARRPQKARTRVPR